jgi:thimet oligopeptidase
MPSQTRSTTTHPIALTEEIHVWEVGGADHAEALTAWVSARLATHEAALAAINTVEGPRTPENTLRLYDVALEQLNLAGSQVSLLKSVAPVDAVRAQALEEAQRIGSAWNRLGLNRAVYDALAAVHLEGASPVTRHYVERTLLGYRLAGVDRDQATRDLLQELQEKCTTLALEFGKNVQEGTLRIEATPEELDGLPADYIARHKPDADGKVVLTTDYPDMQPVMIFAHSAALRERMFLAYNTRAYPANKQILLDLLATRQQIATVLGFRSWADLATADQMIGSAANVRAFLHKLDEASRSGAQREHQLIVDFARGVDPALEEVGMASRSYWYEQFRRKTFNFDSQSVRPYFPYEPVEAGVLALAAQLFRVEFKPSEQKAWHPSVTVYDLYDKGQLAGRFYLDMHPREGKDKWFCATSVVTGVEGRYLPEAGLICNFPGGETGDPGLMEYSSVVTFLHEFGHLMHALLGGRTEWAGVSGFATEGDFIEVPSQTLEEFFRDQKLLQAFARHHETGEPLPADLIRRMKGADAFGRADGMRAQLNYTTLSLDLHDQDPASIDLDHAIRASYERFQPWTWLDGNRMYASFGHLTSYTSNYYTYALDKVIALDFFNQFDANNLLDCPAAERYRTTVLEQGGSKPGSQMVRDFLGRAEDFSAFTNWLNEEFESGLI